MKNKNIHISAKLHNVVFSLCHVCFHHQSETLNLHFDQISVSVPTGCEFDMQFIHKYPALSISSDVLVECIDRLRLLWATQNGVTI